MRSLFPPCFSCHTHLPHSYKNAEQGAGVKQTSLEGSVTPRKAGGRWDYTRSQSHASKDVSENVED